MYFEHSLKSANLKSKSFDDYLFLPQVSLKEFKGNISYRGAEMKVTQNLFAITSSKNICRMSISFEILGDRLKYNFPFSSFDCYFCQASGTEPIPGRLEIFVIFTIH